MTSFEVFIISKLDSWLTIGGVAFILASSTIIGCWIGAAIYEMEEEKKQIKKVKKSSLIILIISLLFISFVPSTDTVTKMIVIPKLLSTNTMEQLEKLPPSLLKLAAKTVEKLTKELESSTNSSKE